MLEKRNYQQGITQPLCKSQGNTQAKA